MGAFAPDGTKFVRAAQAIPRLENLALTGVPFTRVAVLTPKKWRASRRAIHTRCRLTEATSRTAVCIQADGSGVVLTDAEKAGLIGEPVSSSAVCALTALV